MERSSLKTIILNNYKLIKELHSFDKRRIIMTSLYWICDNFDIVAMNVLLLPFLYYAIDNSLSIISFITIDSIIIGVLLVCDTYQAFYRSLYVEKSDQTIKYKCNKKVFMHIKDSDLEQMYDPFFIDMVNRILDMGFYTITAAFDMQWWAISTFVLIACYFLVLINIDALLILIAILTAFISFFINLKFNKLNYKNVVQKQKIEREKRYITDRFGLFKYAPDQKTSDLSSILKKKMHAITDKTYDRINSISKKMQMYNIVKNMIVFLTTTSATWLYLAFNYLLTGSVNLSVTEVIIAETMMQQLCNVLTNISTIGPNLMENSMYANDYFCFLERQPIIESEQGKIEPLKQAHTIEFSNVCFSYDNQSNILKNINLHINQGEKVAIVGKNGAGKSTLVKLLLRLYKPQKGSITFDDIKVEDYDLKKYRERFGVAFQNARVYSASIAENVLMDSFNPSDDITKKRIHRILDELGLGDRIRNESKGIEATYSKEFDAEGVELSGGQMQRLALARVFAQECGVVILDEPSAALDPISETELYFSILEMIKEKTAIFISHRLGICRNMDRILVLDNGIIVEEGNHEDLLSQNGLYAEMWNAQATGYTSKNIKNSIWDEVKTNGEKTSD